MANLERLIIGIDASRNRSGGAKAHLIGVLSSLEPQLFQIKEVHVWSYKSLLDSLPDCIWLIKHNPPELELSLLKQIKWQYAQLPKEAKSSGCDIMLYTDAGAFVNFYPCVVMSRDMLSFEAGEMRRFGISKARMRLVLLKYVQAYSLKKATAAIFLTEYASKIIQKFTGPLANSKVIHHGVSDSFRLNLQLKPSLEKHERIECIYVSNASMYKHQWNVIEAVHKVRSQGYDIHLLLVGGGAGKAQEMVESARFTYDPKGEFVTQMDFIRHGQINQLLANSDIFIFASSCENMPNTLVEGMSAGLPIICSNRGPMPEVLRGGGLYFDPEKPEEISIALKNIIVDNAVRIDLAAKSKRNSLDYSWQRCANETFAYLCDILNNFRTKSNK